MTEAHVYVHVIKTEGVFFLLYLAESAPKTVQFVLMEWYSNFVVKFLVQGALY